MTSRPLLLAAAALLAGAASAAEVHRWVDAQGRVHYSDRPVRGSEPVEVKPGSGESPDAATEADQAAKAANCEKQRKLLDEYRRADSIKETDALGNEREYTPEERSKLIAIQQKKVDDSCASAG